MSRIFMKLKKLQVLSSKFQDRQGYAAVFSFVIMLTIIGSIISVFLLMALNTLYAGRITAVNLKNFYATDGLAEDALRRIYDPAVPDAVNGETLVVGDATVTLSIGLDGLLKKHMFSAQIQSRYSANETLIIDDTNPLNIKIKEWKESL